MPIGNFYDPEIQTKSIYFSYIHMHIFEYFHIKFEFSNILRNSDKELTFCQVSTYSSFIIEKNTKSSLFDVFLNL